MGEGEAAMGIWSRIFRFRLTKFKECNEITIAKIKSDQMEIRERLEKIGATLNGEEGWFLTLLKKPGGSDDYLRHNK